MKLLVLELENHINGSKFILSFEKDLTLLVGMSGVGKSRILAAIENVKKLAQSKITGVGDTSWKLLFSIDNINYTWKGSLGNNSLSGPYYITETLLQDTKEIYTRDNTHVIINGISYPAVSDKLSVLSIYWGIYDIKKIYDEISQIHLLVSTNLSETHVPLNLIEENVDGLNSVSLSYSDYTVYEKMALSWKYDMPEFDEIKENFINVFPVVEDMKFEYDRFGREYMLYIKEKNTDWIGFNNLSSGMMKGLYHIACLSLMPRGSILLIDEIENSLGAKCLDLISDMISNNEREYQIIITSHHPYIINNVDVSHWQVVIRDNGTIYTKSGHDLGLGRSRHEAFKQLLNLEEYIEGIF